MIDGPQNFATIRALFEIVKELIDSSDCGPLHDVGQRLTAATVALDEIEIGYIAEADAHRETSERILREYAADAGDFRLRLAKLEDEKIVTDLLLKRIERLQNEPTQLESRIRELEDRTRHLVRCKPLNPYGPTL